MRAVIKAWWHSRRYVDCAVCDREFRKGQGSGMSREVVCSDACWSASWMQWFSRTLGGQR